MNGRNNLPQEVSMESRAAPAPVPPGRRSFFRWLTFGLGGAASAIAALPIVGYILGTKSRSVHWIDLGSVDDFAAGETRLVTFANPLSQPWDGMTAHTGVYVRRLEED